jgi:hypothetical protein
MRVAPPIHMTEVPEPDWRIFRELRERGLERFCRRVLDEIEGIRADESQSYQSRYGAVYRLLQERDRQLARAFDSPRRSQMLIQLAAMVVFGAVERGELSKFTQRTRGSVETLVSVMDR